MSPRLHNQEKITFIPFVSVQVFFFFNLFLGSSVKMPVAAEEITCPVASLFNLGLSLCPLSLARNHSQSPASFFKNLFLLFFFFLMVVPTAHGSSRATAVAMSDPLTHCVYPGIGPRLP